jgi:hypothetical protein
MLTSPSDALRAAMQRLTDPRPRRGVRHPFGGLLALTRLGLLCRQPDFLSIARWARDHGDPLRGALGFPRRYAPHPTTRSRACARFCRDEFREALRAWLLERAGPPDPLTAADGRRRRQA